MKIIKLIIVTIALAQAISAQELIETTKMYSVEDSIVEAEKIIREQPETLFKSQQGFGGYFAFSTGYARLNGMSTFVSGGRLMFVANHYLGIGFGGKGFVTSPKSSPYISPYNPNVTTQYMSNAGGYGGLYIEPVVKSLKAVHVAFPVLLGAGAMTEAKWDNAYHDSYNAPIEHNISSAFFVVEPGIDVVFNIAKWFRIGLGASYTFTGDIEGLTEFSHNAMDGFNYNMTFKMGWF